MELRLVPQADEVVEPDTTLVIKVRIVTQEYHRGLMSKDEYLERLLELINEEF